MSPVYSVFLWYRLLHCIWICTQRALCSATVPNKSQIYGLEERLQDHKRRPAYSLLESGFFKLTQTLRIVSLTYGERWTAKTITEGYTRIFFETQEVKQSLHDSRLWSCLKSRRITGVPLRSWSKPTIVESKIWSLHRGDCIECHLVMWCRLALVRTDVS
jgi:hypothetical protein